jgi:uncharacterized protein (TIGR03118 family)
VARFRSLHGRRVLAGAVVGALVAGLLPATAVATDPQPQIPVIAPGSAYRQRDLVSDMPGRALLLDPFLVDPWGIAMASPGRFVVANDGTSTARYLRGDVSGSPLVTNEFLTVPGGLPTGAVANPLSSGFVVSSGAASGSARFLWSSITGNIVGWNPNVPAPGSTAGRIGAANPGHVYMGLALANNGSGNLLYAADFANDAVDVYDSSFALQSAASFPFADPTIPSGPGTNYNVFNIQNLGGSLYVTYALANDSTGQPVEGVGNGFVRRFNTSGVRDLTFGINNGALNVPSGLVIAPGSFGIFGGALLVANNGRGNPSIHAYNPTTGAFLGTLQDEAGEGIEIDGLHSLVFGNGDRAGDPGTMYFTAGSAEGEHGLFGSLTPTETMSTNLLQFGTDEYSIAESSTRAQITVTRAGDLTHPAAVRFATWDESQPGHASQKADYQTHLGVLSFAAGESSKTFDVRIVNDRFDEGLSEVVNLALSNPAGTGAGLGSPAFATLTIVDDDSSSPSSNIIDDTNFFIRQQYLDLLGREPTASERSAAAAPINACSTASCRKSRRNTFANNLLYAPETVDSIGLAYRLHKAAFASDPLYGEVMLSVGVRRMRGLTAQLSTLMGDPRFVARYTGTTNTTYVRTLAANTGYAFTTAQKNAWIAALNGGSMTRSTVLLAIARHAGFQALVRNRWTVLAGFWAWCRRDPDTSTFNARLNQLNAGGGNALASGVIDSFISSSEYRQRFGPS